MQIVFTASNKLLAKIIRYLTSHSWLKSARVSHSAFRFGGGESNWMIESSIHGMAPNFWPRFKNHQKIQSRFEMINIDEKVLENVIEEFIEKNLYRPYGYLGLIGFAVTIIVYWITGRKIKNFLANHEVFKGFMCSEMVYRVMAKYTEKTGQKVFDEFDPELIFPEDVLIQCEKKTDLFKKVEG